MGDFMKMVGWLVLGQVLAVGSGAMNNATENCREAADERFPETEGSRLCYE